MVSYNIDMILYVPVVRKLWKQHELWDGTYTITDLLDINEAMGMWESNKAFILESEMEKVKAETNIKNGVL